METSAYIALSRQAALRRQLDVVANNMANMNTTAYKGEQMMFVQHLVKSKGGESFAPTKLAFSRDIAQFRDTAEGPMRATNNPLDVAIKENGYFSIETPEGERYTRNGRFELDNEGQLVTQHGYPVLSEAGTAFVLAPDDKDISIARDGTLSTNNGELGRVKIVSFEDRQKLQKEEGGLLSTEQTPKDVDDPVVIQGALEGSNVNPIIELTKMIKVQRAYDGVKAFIDREDQRQRKMIERLAPRG